MSKLETHIVFVKGTVYSQHMTGEKILCTKTTCNYSTQHWEGTVISDWGKYPKGHTGEWIANDTWKTKEELEKANKFL